MQNKTFYRLFRLAVAAGVITLALSGCDEGSISDPTLVNSHYANVGGRQREIDELDLLGTRGQASESDIQTALHSGGHSGVHARPGSSILVVQSGASAPDSIMLGALDRTYRAFPFSGVSDSGKHREGELGRELRLAAARSGCDYVLCYWGKLESIREVGITKTISWVPVVGGLIPDEARTTRLRVRALLIDVATGRSAAFAPPAVQSSEVSAGFARDSSHDKQMYDLKVRAYNALTSEL